MRSISIFISLAAVVIICLLLASYFTYEDRDINTSHAQTEPLSKLMNEMDRRAAREAVERQSTSGDKNQRFKDIWMEIKSKMRDPDSGTYPVRYYTPDDGVPLIGDMHSTTSRVAWVDNNHVAYWAGVSDTYPIESRPLFKAYELVILNVDTGKIVNVIGQAKYHRFLCADPITGNFRFSVETEGNGDRGYYLVMGQLDKNMQFVKEKDDHHADYKLNRVDCGMYEKGDGLLTGTRMRQGDGVVVSKPVNSGNFERKKRLNGDIQTFSVNFHVGHSFKYDHTRDQYYVGAVFSKEDQRTKIFYFDRAFEPVDEFVLPRVKLPQSYPSSLVFLAGVPLKDGLALQCGRRGAEEGLTDFDGEAISKYLCHVKRDQTIVRAVKGYPRHYASSPDGCRVFGFVSENMKEVAAGKNFLVDTCK